MANTQKNAAFQVYQKIFFLCCQWTNVEYNKPRFQQGFLKAVKITTMFLLIYKCIKKNAIIGNSKK